MPNQTKPTWWTFYKLFIIALSIGSMLMMCFYTIPGIVIFIFSLLLWGAQYRREKQWEADQLAERRHQEQLRAMRQNPNYPPPSPPQKRY